jgi:hypothetical protein
MRPVEFHDVVRSRSDIYKFVLSLIFLLQNASPKSCKIKRKEHLKVLVFFCIEKFKNEGGRGNVTLHVAAQDVKLDCGFGPRPVLVCQVWSMCARTRYGQHPYHIHHRQNSVLFFCNFKVRHTRCVTIKMDNTVYNQ